MRPIHVARCVETFHAGHFFRKPDSLVGQGCSVVFFIDFEMDIFLQGDCDAIGFNVAGWVLVSGTGNN